MIAGLFLLTTSLTLLKDGALDAQEAAPAKAVGTVSGKVRLEGRFKKPPPLKVNKNRDFCGAEVPNESLVVSHKGELRNVIVIVHARSSDKKRKSDGTGFLDNKNCAFVPHVQVAPVGSEILLLNSDPILHDVHARIGSETLFNVGLPAWRTVKKRLTREDIVTVVCDVLHTWQTAYIVVTSSPYFAVTDQQGQFIIDRIPAGTYELEVWHEKLGRLVRKVVVRGGHASKVDLVFPSYPQSVLPGKEEGRL